MIDQCRFSKTVMFFQKGFCERWGLSDYRDRDASCFFAGVYKQEDVDAINNHKGFKVVWNSGRPERIFSSINPNNVIVMVGIGIEFSDTRYKIKNTTFEIKDFSMFRPNVLGDSVYVYLGNEKSKHRYGYDIIEEVKKKIPYRVLYGMHSKIKVDNIAYVKKNFYDKSFVNIKIPLFWGLTTAQELAHMGRKTIANSPAPFCLQYNSVSDIVNIINQEAKKIGTIQPSQIGNFYTIGDGWKNESFWL